MKIVTGRLRSFRSKLQTAFVALGLLAIGVTEWEASAWATSALRQATYDRLAAIRETRARQIERYFEDAGNHVLALSTDEAMIAALEQFRDSWAGVPLTARGTARDEELRRYYESSVAPRWSAQPDAARLLEAWYPKDGRVRTLQSGFIAGNPHPTGSKSLLLEAPAAGGYSAIHARYHPTLFRYLSAFGFYDILLIEEREARIVYSVQKEIDLGGSLREEPYSGTALARVFERARALPAPETYVTQDYAPYPPSYFAPASFIAAPVWRAGSKIGVLAIQVSVAEINQVMSGGRKWREEGLGETGQSYVVGPDGTLRSDVRAAMEKPEEFFERLRGGGVDPAAIARIRRNGTAVLTLPVAAELNARLRNGEEGTEIEEDARGNQVLRSFKRIDVPGLTWSLVAEIEVREALGPVTMLRMRILGFGLLIAAAFLLASRRLAASVTRPVLALVESARRLGGRDFAARVAVESSDEIGELAASFNRMAEQLERTTVSKGQVERTLAALINAVFVIEVPAGADAEAILGSRIVSANPAALELLRYPGQELIGSAFRRVLPEDAEQWREWMERVLAAGRLPAVEATLAPREGAPIAVLFTAALTAGEGGAAPGIVCAAQDITDRKLAEAEIRRKQKELERLTERLITAQEDERRRLARELHDDATQRLAALAIEAGRLARLPAEEARAGVDRIKQELIRVSEEIHGFSRRLHPATLDDLGLAAAIESACRGFFEQGEAPVDLEIEGAVDDLPGEVQLALYRIVQEGLANIRRHAGADQVSIRLAAPRGAPVVLEIRDSGRGFRRDDPEWRPGLGLASMEERTRLLGGRFQVESAPGQGTTIQVTVPNGARDETATSTTG